MRKLFRYLSVLSISLLLGSEALAADPNLLVEFTYRGKQFSIQGEKVDGAFLFNKGGEKKIWLTTLDWMPYIGRSVCKQGWVQQFAIALFVSQGYEVKSTFYPWARTIVIAENGTADILYPEWYIDSSAPSDVAKDKKRRDNLALSERFPGGPIAFMKRKGEPFDYKGKLEMLKGEKIAVVRGYQNTPEFDTLMDQGFFNIQTVTNDLIQAKVLWAKRVNLLINDPLVVRYTVANSALSRAEKNSILDNLEVVQPMIQYNYLYFAVSKKKPEWQSTLDVINKTIQEFESTGLMFEIIKNTLNYCNLNMDEIFAPYQNAHP